MICEMKTCALVFAVLLCGRAFGAADEVKVSSFGFDREDSTAFVQSALDSGARRVVFDRQSSDWIVRPLFVRSDTEIVFEEGVVLMAKSGEFMGLRDALVSLVSVTNVTLRGLGKGATLRMRYDDYQKPPYKVAQWRHAVNLLSAVNVRIENLRLERSGGDGVYVGKNEKTKEPCRDIAISSCECEHNNRQGVSVISVDGLLIEKTVLSHTGGHPPHAGIDFEPNSSSEVLKRIVMRDTMTLENRTDGVHMNFGMLGSDSEPVDLRFENCRFVGDGRCGLNMEVDSWRKGGPMRGGSIVLKGCRFEGCGESALRVMDKPEDCIPMVVEDCEIVNCTTNICRSEVEIGNCSVKADRNTGGVEFRRLTVRHPWRRPWCCMGGTIKTQDVSVVTESVEVISPEGRETVNCPKCD